MVHNNQARKSGKWKWIDLTPQLGRPDYGHHDVQLGVGVIQPTGQHVEEFLPPALIVAQAFFDDLSLFLGTQREKLKLPNKQESSVDPQKLLKVYLIPKVLGTQIYNPHQEPPTIGDELERADAKEINEVLSPRMKGNAGVGQEDVLVEDCEPMLD